MKATKNFYSQVLGYVQKGDEIPDTAHGRHLASVGLAESQTYETKVVRQEPVTRKPVKRRKSRGRKRNDEAAG